MDAGKTGAQELRAAVKAFDYCNESFLDQFTSEELIKIYRVLQKCEWDFLPDTWTKRQVKEALQGKVPRWDDSKDKIKPVY